VSGDARYEALTEGDLGLILHRLCDLTHHTMPNKLFDYMSVGLPVVATRMRPVARVIAAEGCGVLVDDNAESVAQAIEGLLGDAELRERLGRNGKQALNERYRWDGEGRRLLRSVESVSAG
jgi:glycosyltransferase involved in cell wall biosynthesis